MQLVVAVEVDYGYKRVLSLEAEGGVVPRFRPYSALNSLSGMVFPPS